MIVFFKHPKTAATLRAEIHYSEIPSFCGGRTLHSLSVLEMHTVEGDYTLFDSLLDGVLSYEASYFAYGSMHIHDCEDGRWDCFLFNRLPSSMQVETEARDYEFILTPYYRNGNSGNMVRSLTIISRSK